MNAWIVGSAFHHRYWWDGNLPALCVVERVKRGTYKGEPKIIVTIQEVGGRRRASYFQNQVPARTKEQMQWLTSPI